MTLAINNNTNTLAQPYYGDNIYTSMKSTAASEPAPMVDSEQHIEMVAKGVIELFK